jgi:hypothetical protein
MNRVGDRDRTGSDRLVERAGACWEVAPEPVGGAGPGAPGPVGGTRAGACCEVARNQLVEVVPEPVGGTRAGACCEVAPEPVGGGGSGTSWWNARPSVLVERVGTRWSMCGPPQEDPRPARGARRFFITSTRPSRATTVPADCSQTSVLGFTEPELAQALRAGGRASEKTSSAPSRGSSDRRCGTGSGSAGGTRPGAPGASSAVAPRGGSAAVADARDVPSSRA